jgi:hypothetical protein
MHLTVGREFPAMTTLALSSEAAGVNGMGAQSVFAPIGELHNFGLFCQVMFDVVAWIRQLLNAQVPWYTEHRVLWCS